MVGISAGTGTEPNFGRSLTISLGELEKWCLENQAIPVQDNEPFVVNFISNDDCSSYEEDDDDGDKKNSGAYFALFISTKRLLEIASRATHIHADATYKLIWQGFPVLVVGTTDLNKAFHPFGLAVCKDEQTKDFEFLFSSLQIGLDKIGRPRIEPSALVSDASFAIINAFSNIFPNKHDTVMCWAHMKRAVETKSAMIEDQELRAEMMDDIELLQICESAKLFHQSVKLFLKKWAKTPSVGPFISYFKSEWLEKHPGWFEGVSLFVPSTNNALESTNRTLKDKVNRKRLALAVFLSNANKIVSGWSYDRDDSNVNAKNFATEPTISHQLWTKSYQWAKQKKEIKGASQDGKTTYLLPAGSKETLDETEVKRFKTGKYSTFSQFKSHFNVWRVVSFDLTGWKSSQCNCPYFLKNYMCKHVVGMGIRLKKWKAPNTVKPGALDKKRKRGRPKNITKALLLDKD